jgi:hypothetical protein
MFVLLRVALDSRLLLDLKSVSRKDTPDVAGKFPGSQLEAGHTLPSK